MTIDAGKVLGALQVIAEEGPTVAALIHRISPLFSPGAQVDLQAAFLASDKAFKDTDKKLS